ncbi:MAG: Wzz/FepE/Etk N-terminal domain-containing protein, partial [Microcystaceae cyanobacterium]
MSKIFAITLRHWRPLTLWNALVLGATATTLIVSPRVWTATTQLTMPGSNGNLDANLGILGSLRNNGSDISSTQDNQLKMQESILKSDALQEKVLAIDPEKAKFSRLAAYKQLFKVSIEEPSRIISINVS